MSSSSVNPVNWITPYKIDVIQGNFVSKEQVEQLQAGMIARPGQGVLGTPLMTSLFHADRWDYVFTLKRQGVEPQAFKYTVFFKGDQLERFSGDAMPSEAEFISTLTNKRKLGQGAGAAKPPKSNSRRLKSQSLPKPSQNRSSEPASAPAGPSATVYPPLESPRQ